MYEIGPSTGNRLNKFAHIDCNDKISVCDRIRFAEYSKRELRPGKKYETQLKIEKRIFFQCHW